MNNVNLTEAGKAVTLAFDLEAMEALYAEYGEDYVAEISRRLTLRDPRCLRLCVESMASKPVDLPALMKKLPVDELALRIANAIALAITGSPIGDPVE